MTVKEFLSQLEALLGSLDVSLLPEATLNKLVNAYNCCYFGAWFVELVGIDNFSMPGSATTLVLVEGDGTGPLLTIKQFLTLLAEKVDHLSPEQLNGRISIKSPHWLTTINSMGFDFESNLYFEVGHSTK